MKLLPERFRGMDPSERLALFGAAIIAAFLLGQGNFLGLIIFVLFAAGLAFAYRVARRLLKKVVWRLRHRLIVSYMFVAVVPMGLLVMLVLFGLYVLIGQIAIYTVYSELERRMANPAVQFTPEFLADLAPHIGDVMLLDPKGLAADKPFQDFRRHHVPLPENRFDIEIIWVSPVTINAQNNLLLVRSRPSAVLRNLFGQKIEWRVDMLGFAAVVGGALLVALLGSVIVGVSITRSITGAVHDLYEGTLKINEGEFKHRIPVRGDDQLAELAKSFNAMTSSLERLIEVEKEKERLHSELGIAREVQRQLFPKDAPAFRTLQVNGICHAAQMVSGDYYDFLSLDSSNLAMAIGDVAGKGISAALLMAAIQSVLRTQLTDGGGQSPARIVGLLNRQLYANTSPEKYATLYFGLYNDAEGMLTYTNAGHLPPILVHSGVPSKLEVTGTVVGAFPVCRYEERQVILAPGDLLVAYTDGITEPENAYGEMFGEERLMDLLVKYQNADATEIIARSIEAVKLWAASPEQEDDMTMVVARRIAG